MAKKATIESLLVKGELFEEAGETDKSLRCYLRLKRLYPDSLPIRLRLGRVYLLTGEPDKAREEFLFYLAGRGDDDEANLFMALIAIGEGDVESALTYLHAAKGLALKAEEKSPAALMAIAAAYQGLDMPEDAISFYQQALNRGRQAVQEKGNLLLGELYYVYGRIENALDSFIKVLGINPMNHEAWNNLGVISYAIGNRDTAAYCCTRACRLNPDYPDAEANLADIAQDTVADKQEFPTPSDENKGSSHLPDKNSAKYKLDFLPQTMNLEQNRWEYSQGAVILESSPPTVHIGTYCRCNARCPFCPTNSWPCSFDLDLYQGFIEKKLGNALRLADTVSFCGLGEFLLAPRIEEIIRYINRSLPFSTKTITTNGIPLRNSLAELLAENRYNIQISLHAARPETHRRMTGTTAFNRIMRQIEHLVKVRERMKSPLYITLLFVMNRYNVAEAPDFVRLADRLGADQVRFDYMTVFEPEHVDYSCFFAQETTNEMLLRARDFKVRKGFCLTAPALFGEQPASALEPEVCRNPWDFVYMDSHARMVNACCYAGENIGNLNSHSFEEIWNGLKYQGLRKGLFNRKEHRHCKDCIKFRVNNINNFRSHVTFRTRNYSQILSEYERVAAEVGLSFPAAAHGVG